MPIASPMGVGLQITVRYTHRPPPAAQQAGAGALGCGRLSSTARAQAETALSGSARVADRHYPVMGAAGGCREQSHGPPWGRRLPHRTPRRGPSGLISPPRAATVRVWGGQPRVEAHGITGPAESRPGRSRTNPGYNLPGVLGTREERWFFASTGGGVSPGNGQVVDPATEGDVPVHKARWQQPANHKPPYKSLGQASMS
jgi:hypothetical protein